MWQDELKPPEPACNESDVVVPGVQIPQIELPPEAPLTNQLPVVKQYKSLEEELGHLFGEDVFTKFPPKEISKTTFNKATFKRTTPPPEPVAKWLDGKVEKPKSTTGLKRTYPSAMIGPKSSKKPKELIPKAKFVVQKVDEEDLMPELGINELRRKYKVPDDQNQHSEQRVIICQFIGENLHSTCDTQK